MDNHPIQWTSPSPLWPELANRPNGSSVPEFGVPAILRFATDDFMQDFINTLETDPRKLGEFRAMPETWRGKVSQPTIPTPKKLFALQMQRLASRRNRPVATGAKVSPLPSADQLPRLKLYQPAHQRYYLITACLTCGVAGLPDRTVDSGKEERACFVLRRLFPSDPQVPNQPVKEWDEYAWVRTPAGHIWKKVRTATQITDKFVVEGEERLPLFATTFQEDDQRSRRLFAGLIPVGKREAYLGAQKVAGDPEAMPGGTTSISSRKILLRKQVIEPWKALVKQIASAGTANRTRVDDDGDEHTFSDPATAASTQSAREYAQAISWLILLDLAKFLQQYLPPVFDVIEGEPKNVLSPKQKAAFNALKAIKIHADLTLFSDLKEDSTITYVAASLVDALKRVAKFETGLESPYTEPYRRDTANSDWPDFLFPLADPEKPGQAPLPPLSLDRSGSDEDDQALRRIDSLLGPLVQAMDEHEPNGPASEPEIPTAAIPPEDPLNAVFRIRCVYERPACGPLHEDVVSDPTEPFDLAGFFDPDAPARPIRIGLPFDTTPAGLRKFDKNTAFIMSDILCGQVAKLKSLGLVDLVRAVLPWPLHKDLSIGDMKPCGSPSANFGTICSLSIPIVTICALILLMIMVAILDYVLHWLPFFMVCFKLPGFTRKPPKP